VAMTCDWYLVQCGSFITNVWLILTTISLFIQVTKHTKHGKVDSDLSSLFGCLNQTMKGNEKNREENN